MNTELEALESRIESVVALVDQLRAENEVLRNQIAAAEAERRALVRQQQAMLDQIRKEALAQAAVRVTEQAARLARELAESTQTAGPGEAFGGPEPTAAIQVRIAEERKSLQAANARLAGLDLPPVALPMPAADARAAVVVAAPKEAGLPPVAAQARGPPGGGLPT